MSNSKFERLSDQGPLTPVAKINVWSAAEKQANKLLE